MECLKVSFQNQFDIKLKSHFLCAFITFFFPVLCGKREDEFKEILRMHGFF